MEYDLIIIGAGPAGLTAAIYSGRYKIKTLVISKDSGGLAAMAHKVCNFPSYIDIKGFELIQKIIKQVEDLEVPIIYEEVKKIEKINKKFNIYTEENNYIAKKIIFAGGTTRNKLDIPGENELIGKGISYCATCDSPLFKNKTVGIVGGSDAALTGALLLSEYAAKVYIIYRKDTFFRAEPFWVDLVKKESKIQPLFNEEVLEIIGKNKVEEIKLKSGKNLKLDGVFIEIGSSPNIEFLSNLKLDLTDKGYIKTDKNQRTNVFGFYAAGDITDNSLKQIVTAAGDGATAAFNVYNEIKREENKTERI